MPINPGEMRKPNLGWALSSLAGPVSNIVLATVVFLVFRSVVLSPNDTSLTGLFIAQLIQINVFLAVFNLLPVPPLDGFGVVFGISPRPIKLALMPLMRYGPLILLAVLFLPTTQVWLNQFLVGGARIIYQFLGVLGSAL